MGKVEWPHFPRSTIHEKQPSNQTGNQVHQPDLPRKRWNERKYQISCKWSSYSPGLIENCTNKNWRTLKSKKGEKKDNWTKNQNRNRTTHCICQTINGNYDIF